MKIKLYKDKWSLSDGRPTKYVFKLVPEVAYWTKNNKEGKALCVSWLCWSLLITFKPKTK